MATTLDLKGLKCPLPVLKARKAMEMLDAGTELTVLVTDPAAPADFRAFCDETAHRLVSSDQDGEVFVLTLRKG